MNRSMDVYCKLGLPGCVGSIDATFVLCDKLPSAYSNLLSGEKGRGLLFNVVVDHSRRVLSVQPPVFATINDKQSVKYNEFIERLNNKEIYANSSYKLRTGPEAEDIIPLSSTYVIADGGYIKIPTIMCAFANAESEVLRVRYKFNDWIGSVRKDVECFFGILKQRFRILGRANSYHKFADVENKPFH